MYFSNLVINACMLDVFNNNLILQYALNIDKNIKFEK